MYWKRQGEYEYLVRTRKDNRPHRIGPRTPELEKGYTDFVESKRAVEARLQGRGAIDRLLSARS